MRPEGRNTVLKLAIPSDGFDHPDGMSKVVLCDTGCSSASALVLHQRKMQSDGFAYKHVHVDAIYFPLTTCGFDDKDLVGKVRRFGGGLFARSAHENSASKPAIVSVSRPSMIFRLHGY
jgi:hypothetical protein